MNFLRNLPNLGNAVVPVLGLGGAATALWKSIYTVDGGHRAIIYSRWSGIKDEVTGEGTHFCIPFLEDPIIFDVRTQPREVSSITGTKDLQMVNIKVRTLTKPMKDRLPRIYRKLGPDYNNRVLPSIVNEVLKNIVSKYDAVQLLTMRDAVSKRVLADLQREANDFNIILDDVAIIDLTFGRDFTAAVEAKQVAEQDAKRALYVVDRAKQEKKARIISAEGETAAAELIGAAVQSNPAYIELERLRAARDIAATVARSANKVYLNADSLLLNLENDRE
jgi:prohibitin 2